MNLRRTARAVAVGLLLLLPLGCGSVGSGIEPPAGGSWQLAFHDEFDGSRLDTGRWVTCYDWNNDGCTNSGNDEEQWYLPRQVSVEDGALRLSAERRTTRGSGGETYPWTSGMVSTGRDFWEGEPRRTFTYGYFEAAVRVPDEKGMFPAFWLMPASRTTPPEIDIMEFIGTTERTSMTVHWKDGRGVERQVHDRYAADDFTDGYHVFALNWQPDSLTWYVDGERRYRVTGAERIPHEPMELLINLAVGYPQDPPRSVDAGRMQVDWVRVWQR